MADLFEPWPEMEGQSKPKLAKVEIEVTITKVVAKVRPYRVRTNPKPNIIGASSNENGETVFLIKRPDSTETDWVSKKVAYKEFPLTVLKFYDEHLNLVDADDNEA